jgi:hypothetical protein
MNITVIAPPAKTRLNPNRPRFNWKPLAAALASSQVGTWLSVPLADLPNEEKQVIQTGIHACAHRSSARVQTQVEDDSMLIYVTSKNQS